MEIEILEEEFEGNLEHGEGIDSEEAPEEVPEVRLKNEIEDSETLKEPYVIKVEQDDSEASQSSAVPINKTVNEPHDLM